MIATLEDQFNILPYIGVQDQYLGIDFNWLHLSEIALIM